MRWLDGISDLMDMSWSKLCISYNILCLSWNDNTLQRKKKMENQIFSKRKLRSLCKQQPGLIQNMSHKYHTIKQEM